jgi:predicted membrane protein
VSTPRREPRVTNPGPGRGAGVDRDPDRAAALSARIAIVATIVVGQLWGLTVALNSWFQHETTAVWTIVAFEAVSFAVAFAVWFAGKER